jgi:DNA-binding MarR family transcriptional regulator
MKNTEAVEKNFLGIYSKMRLLFYHDIFGVIREREGSLSAMEAFSVEVIEILGEPTIGQFADFLNISQSNATYKVNSLIKKGYIEKQNSTVDRREYHLILSQKYYKYRALMGAYIDKIIERMGEGFSDRELEQLGGFLETINKKMMPEYDDIVSGRE